MAPGDDKIVNSEFEFSFTVDTSPVAMRESLFCGVQFLLPGSTPIIMDLNLIAEPLSNTVASLSMSSSVVPCQLDLPAEFLASGVPAPSARSVFILRIVLSVCHEKKERDSIHTHAVMFNNSMQERSTFTFLQQLSISL